MTKAVEPDHFSRWRPDGPAGRGVSWVPGRFGSGLSFNAQRYVELGYAQQQSNWTVALWVKSRQPHRWTGPTTVPATAIWRSVGITRTRIFEERLRCPWEGTGIRELRALTAQTVSPGGDLRRTESQGYKNGALVTDHSAPSGHLFEAPRSSWAPCRGRTVLHGAWTRSASTPRD